MDKILFVDDEPNLLNAFKRKLGSNYEFITSTSPAEALQILQNKAPVSIVISDMHMPGMQGAEFLKEVAKKSPDSIRVMLTGLGDQRTAVKAINDGAVFRFLNKPCSAEDLEIVLNDCVAQYRLQQQEKDLLQNTLGGVLSLVNDLLSFIDPEGVQRATRIRKILREMHKIISLPILELELAAMFKGLGKLSLPLELLLKNSQGDELTKIEEGMFFNSQQTSARLIRQIPRLEKVSNLIEMLCNLTQPATKLEKSAILAFKLAEKIAYAENPGEDVSVTVDRISNSLTPEEIALATELAGRTAVSATKDSVAGYCITVSELIPGQVLVEDLKDKRGKLLLRKGFLITSAIIERIKNHLEFAGLEGKLTVNERIPTRTT